MIPSPVYWLIVPSKRWTPGERIAKKRSMILCHSSGSSCSARSIEPFTSAKSTVTCFRSPSRALRDVRIFSARCFGVYERGSAARSAIASAWTCPPQPLQKREPAGFDFPHREQTPSTAAPQPLQKRAPPGFSWPHDGHVTLPPPSRPAPRRVGGRSPETGGENELSRQLFQERFRV